jgi:hypothetical protein
MGTIDSQILNNIEATGQPKEVPPCGVIGGSSKWFGLRPQADGIMQIDTVGSSFDTVLAVYTGTNSILSLRTVDCDNNGVPGEVWSRVTFSAMRGTNYAIAVDGVEGEQGTIQLNWRLGSQPSFTPPTQTAQSARLGDTLLLEANSSSATSDLSYQWYLNTQTVNGAATRQLLLTNLQPSQAGTYRVVARNFAGSVTGIVATVSVATPVQVTAGIVVSNSTSMFRLSGGAGRAYVIEASSNLIQWLPVYTNIETFAPLQFFDAASSGTPRRFYRVMPWP